LVFSLSSRRASFESIAERKLRHRQLTVYGNVEINGRDLREGGRAAKPLSSGRGEACRY
jgi:hypothetical protein